MNIFVLDESPYKAAVYHNDQHCVKMILEYTQMLAMAHMMLDGTGLSHPNATVRKLGQARTYRNHPCALWARANDANYRWLYACLHELTVEFQERYGHVHLYARSGNAVDQLKEPPRNIVHAKHISKMPQCMPEEFRRMSAVDAYRAYYIGKKTHNWSAPAVVPHWVKGVDHA